MTCRQSKLAERGPCRIDYCSCGKVHLSYGQITLHLTPERLRDLGACIDMGMQRLPVRDRFDYPPVTKVYED